jgi:hypothetical protein
MGITDGRLSEILGGANSFIVDPIPLKKSDCFLPLGTNSPTLLLGRLAWLVLVARIPLLMLLLDGFGDIAIALFDLIELIVPLVSEDDGCVNVSH